MHEKSVDTLILSNVTTQKLNSKAQMDVLDELGYCFVVEISPSSSSVDEWEKIVFLMSTRVYSMQCTTLCKQE